MPSDGRIALASESSPLINEALALARAVHGREMREDGCGGAPFFDHLTVVAECLLKHGYGDEVIAAGLLHDSVEHGGLDPGELRARLGNRVTEIVLAMTEDASIDDQLERKRDLRDRVAAAGADACAVFAADKAANVVALRAAYENRGESVDRRLPIPLDDKILLWEYDLEMLHGNAPGMPLAERFAEELLGLWGQRQEARQAVL